MRGTSRVSPIIVLMSARFRISLATLLWMTVALAIGLAAGLSPWVTRNLLVAVAPFLNPMGLILLTIAFPVAAPAFQLWLVSCRAELPPLGHVFLWIHGLYVFGYWSVAVLLIATPSAPQTVLIVGNAVLVLFWSTVATAVLWAAVAAVHARFTPALRATGVVVALEYAGMAIAVAMIHAVFLL